MVWCGPVRCHRRAGPLQAYEASTEAVAGTFRNKEEFRAALVRTAGINPPSSRS